MSQVEQRLQDTPAFAALMRTVSNVIDTRMGPTVDTHLAHTRSVAAAGSGACASRTADALDYCVRVTYPECDLDTMIRLCATCALITIFLCFLLLF